MQVLQYIRGTKSWGDEVSPRTGRPKAMNPMSFDVKARLDAETDKKLTEYCENHNVSRSDAVRKGIHLILVQK